ncbi:MAG: NYN domain-containing protein [Lachnospiraceae bacterium]|nr:NYN domain-containing protein [Lachnospiraceae bacterium]
MNDKKYAVLIDGDNVSSEYMSTIQREIISKYGVPTYKRVYGDWTSPRFKGWRETITQFPLVPIQQFNNSKGKNATDITLIIDAMDILYTGNVDGFCIVSNDGDFTKLATRLKESGKEVIGMGLSTAQELFKRTCTRFVNLEVAKKNNENIPELDDEGENSDDTVHGTEEMSGRSETGGGMTDNLSDKAVSYNGEAKSGGNNDGDSDRAEEVLKKSEILPKEKIIKAIIGIIIENDNQGRNTYLGEVGSKLVMLYPDFDVRNYGYSKLATMIEETNVLELIKDNTEYSVKIKKDEYLEASINNSIIKFVREHGSENVDLSEIGKKIREIYPDFNVKRFGYATLRKYLSNIRELEVSEDGKSVRIAR